MNGDELLLAKKEVIDKRTHKFYVVPIIPLNIYYTIRTLWVHSITAVSYSLPLLMLITKIMICGIDLMYENNDNDIDQQEKS